MPQCLPTVLDLVEVIAANLEALIAASRTEISCHRGSKPSRVARNEARPQEGRLLFQYGGTDQSSLHQTSQLPLRRARRNQTSKARRSDFVRRRPPNRSVGRCLADRCGLPLFPTLRLGFDTCRPLLGKFSRKEQTAAELILCSKFLVGVIGLNTNAMQPLAVRRCRNREREYIISQSSDPFDGFSTFATTSCLSRSKIKIVGHG